MNHTNGAAGDSEDLCFDLDELARPRMIGNRLVRDMTFYRLSRELFYARIRSGLMQKQVARMMGTTASAVSRLENAAGHRPTLTTLERYADVTNCYLDLQLIPLFTLDAFRAMSRHRG